MYNLFFERASFYHEMYCQNQQQQQKHAIHRLFYSSKTMFRAWTCKIGGSYTAVGGFTNRMNRLSVSEDGLIRSYVLVNLKKQTFHMFCSVLAGGTCSVSYTSFIL